MPTPIYYYYFEAAWPSDKGTTVVDTPALGATAPSVYFVSQDHLGDLDSDKDLLDIFDVIRLVGAVEWGELRPLAHAEAIRLRWRRPSRHRIRSPPRGGPSRPISNRATTRPAMLPRPALNRDVKRATLITIGDGSSLAVPRTFSGTNG